MRRHSCGKVRPGKCVADRAAKVGRFGSAHLSERGAVNRRDPFAGGHDIEGSAEANRVAEKFAQRASRRLDRGLSTTVASEPWRWTPVISPERSVTIAIIAGLASICADLSER